MRVCKSPVYKQKIIKQTEKRKTDRQSAQKQAFLQISSFNLTAYALADSPSRRPLRSNSCSCTGIERKQNKKETRDLTHSPPLTGLVIFTHSRDHLLTRAQAPDGLHRGQPRLRECDGVQTGREPKASECVWAFFLVCPPPLSSLYALTYAKRVCLVPSLMG